MSEENTVTKTICLLMAGRRTEATAELLRLYRRITKSKLRLQLIDALLSALDPKKENQQLIDLSSEGIKLAEDLKLSDLRAHLMSRKAEFLANKSSMLNLQRAELKLASGWRGFSTEADKNSFELLTAEIESLEKEIDRLLSDAIAIARQAGNKKVLGFVFMSKGYVEGSRYLDYKVKCISLPWKSNVRLLLNKLGLKIPLIFGFPHYRRLKAYIDSFTKSYLEAARLLEEVDDVAAGRAYYDLAFQLKTAFKFCRASNYLRKAKIIADRYNDAVLSAQVRKLKKSIKARNRDIPNYIERKQ